MFNAETPFDLPSLPPDDVDLGNEQLSDLLIKARSSLAELKGYSFSMPNPLLLLSPTILRESIESSEIENVHTTIVNVLESQVIPEEERSGADRKVLNYRDALLWGFRNLNSYAVSTRLITGIQSQLLPEHEGKYRREQNHIVNHVTGEVLYTPPRQTEIARLMGDWESFVNTTDELDPLVKAAVAHYQFEAIHPFDDGNGRTGRILIILQLIKDDIIRWPILYISGYINRNKTEYYKRLRAVSKEGAWIEFVRYMLKGFATQAEETRNMVLSIMTYLEEFKSQLKEKQPKIYSSDLAELLFTYPFITPTKLSEELDVHYTTASRYLSKLKKSGMLEDAKVGRYHYFINDGLLNKINKKKDQN